MSTGDVCIYQVAAEFSIVFRPSSKGWCGARVAVRSYPFNGLWFSQTAKRIFADENDRDTRQRVK